MRTSILLSMALTFAIGTSCEPVDHIQEEDLSPVQTSDVARMLSELPLTASQFAEVHDAVCSSSTNGYDEEYTMKDLFDTPGAGVGDSMTKAPKKTYERPMRELIAEHLCSTKASSGNSESDYLDLLMGSDLQIYWPFSDSWDGTTAPIITFDPADGSETSTGYRLTENSIGERIVEEVTVDEAMAMETPVWVVNRNSDGDFPSLEILRKMDPDWAMGGSVIIGAKETATTKAGDGSVLRTLILKDFVSHRNYDTWLAGASEFFVKTGAVENFSASTEAEMKLYDPAITDFMVVVKRSQVGTAIPFNAVLVSQWTDQLDSCAFMITEDDGGTQTSWKCSAEVKIQSKTTGFSLDLPFRTRDDIVWRGQLSRQYLEKYSGKAGHFGDVEITFEIVEL